jgi:hypothetical protein
MLRARPDFRSMMKEISRFLSKAQALAGMLHSKGAAMTGDQENAESGKALFDLISDLSAGYRTNAVLTAGLHLAASALVLGSDSLEQAEQQAEMSGERFIAAVRKIWALKYQH